MEATPEKSLQKKMVSEKGFGKTSEGKTTPPECFERASVFEKMFLLGANGGEMFSKNLVSKSPAGPNYLCDHITPNMVRGEERTPLTPARGAVTV